MVLLPARRTKFGVMSPKHWTVNFAKRTGKNVFVRQIEPKGSRSTQLTFFMNQYDKEIVTKYLMRTSDCKLVRLADSPQGILAKISCRRTKLDDLLIKLAKETESRVGMKTRSDGNVEVIIENVWNNEIENKIREIVDSLKVKEKNLNTKTAQIILPTLSEENESSTKPNIDDMDRKIAKTLLLKGYYETPRPNKVTQESICNILDIAKPTLESHMRKIESMGIRKILDIQDFTEREVDLSWEMLQAKSRKKS